MFMININQCSEIQAIRKYLGLEIKEVSKLVGYTTRSWQYWEKGEQIAPQEVLHLLDRLCVFMRKMLTIIQTNQYQSLPYYLDYLDFCKNFPNPTKSQWQIWQKITALSRVNLYCYELTNSGEIDKQSTLYIEFNHYFSENIKEANNND